MGLQFGHDTTANCELIATKWGGIATLELRHAGDTPPASF